MLKKGRFGQFLACSGYPDCKTTKQLGEAQQLAERMFRSEEKCPNCGNHMVRKYGRYGEFVACSLTIPPASSSSRKPSEWKCPNCTEGEVVERRSKRGKTFYMAAFVIPIAILSRGANRFRNGARIAAAAT